MPAFRAGDLDLAFTLRDADGYAALLAAVEFVRIPLIPALLPLLRKLFDLFQFFEEPLYCLLKMTVSDCIPTNNR